jgi:hypothetical protein
MGYKETPYTIYHKLSLNNINQGHVYSGVRKIYVKQLLASSYLLICLSNWILLGYNTAHAFCMFEN